MRFEDNGYIEHMWVANVKYNGNSYSGYINNKPVNITNYSFRQYVTFSTEEISDWVVIMKEKKIGDFTSKVEPDIKSDGSREI